MKPVHGNNVTDLTMSLTVLACSWDACRIVLEVARVHKSPVTLRLTFGGCLPPRHREHDDAKKSTDAAAVFEAITLATAIHLLALQYQVPVVLETETRCLHKLTTWYEPLMERVYEDQPPMFMKRSHSLFSSHFLEIVDASTLEECLDITEQYLVRLSERKIWLHVKLPISAKMLSLEHANPWQYAHERLQRHSHCFSLVVDEDSFSELSKSNLLKSSSTFVVIDTPQYRGPPTSARILSEHLATSLDQHRWQNIMQVQIARPIRVSMEDLGAGGEPEEGNQQVVCSTEVVRQWAHRQHDHLQALCQAALEQCRSKDRLGSMNHGIIETWCNKNLTSKNTTYETSGGVLQVWNLLYPSHNTMIIPRPDMTRMAITSSLVLVAIFVWQNYYYAHSLVTAVW